MSFVYRDTKSELIPLQVLDTDLDRNWIGELLEFLRPRDSRCLGQSTVTISDSYIDTSQDCLRMARDNSEHATMRGDIDNYPVSTST